MTFTVNSASNVTQYFPLKQTANLSLTSCITVLSFFLMLSYSLFADAQRTYGTR